MKKILIALVLGIWSASANASLIPVLGGQAVYDTDLDITWLADANVAAGSAFDDGVSTTDGAMTWVNANAWAASLTVGGLTGWRLPSALNQNGSGPCDPFNCTDSEMGHLFYNELGGTLGNSILTSSDPDLALFSNVQFPYWSDTESASDPTNGAWFFQFMNGVQSTGSKETQFFAWAVHDGDVSVVPIPTAVWLFGSALGLLGWMRGKKA